LAKGNFLEETIKDLDVKKVVRQLVVESEQKYKTLVNNALVGIYIINQSHVLYSNPYIRKLIGYDDPGPIELRKVIESSSWKEVQKRARKRLTGESQIEEYELKLVRTDGIVIDALVRGVRCTYEGSPAILGTLVEITSLKTDKARIRELEDVLQEVPSAIIKVDNSERITFINTNAAALFGVDEQTLVGVPLAMILDESNPEKVVTRLMLNSHKKRFKGTLNLRGSGVKPLNARIRTIPVRDKDDNFAGITMFVEADEMQSVSKRPETLDSTTYPTSLVSCSDQRHMLR
jgi:PAS domain S-box-containing protein